MADGVMTRGDGDRKIGRAIWVIFSWFAGALLAMAVSGLVAVLLFKLTVFGLALCLIGNFSIRRLVSKQSEIHDTKFHKNIDEPK
jgi:uncharacterized protein (DUF58 family)